jgi:hypothetical protein
MYQLFIGLIAEGNTDVRFLKSVIYNSIQDISWECESEVEIFDVRDIKASGDGFVQKMLEASKRARSDYGISVLCIHADSDAPTIHPVMENKFSPFFAELERMDDVEYCKHIVPTIPIQEIESWMLADRELLKQLINAVGFRDVDLGIEKAPELYADPKSVIENAISIAMSHQPKKRRDSITISDLYETLGYRMGLEKLRAIPSFNHFEAGVRKCLKELGLMR